METSGREGPPSCIFDSEMPVILLDVVFASKIEAISAVVEHLMRALRKTCCPVDQAFAVETVLREALANAIVHGNRRNPKKHVRVCCACDSKGDVLIVVADEGEGFDPSKIPSPIIGESILQDHGRGIYLINLLADEVHFNRGGTEIQIRIGKHKGVPPQVSDPSTGEER